LLNPVCFYAINGFHAVLLPALGDVTNQVASESWVLGTRSQLAPDSADAQRLKRDVIALYEADYAKQWDAMLNDLNIVPMHSPDDAVQNLYILASPQSPMRDLLSSVVRQLNLSTPPRLPASAVAEVGKKAATNALPEQPGKEIDERFRALRDYVGSGTGGPID